MRGPQLLLSLLLVVACGPDRSAQLAKVLNEYERLVDEMCACKTMACMDAVRSNKVRPFVKRESRRFPNPKGKNRKRVRALDRKRWKCSAEMRKRFAPGDTAEKPPLTAEQPWPE